MLEKSRKSECSFIGRCKKRLQFGEDTEWRWHFHRLRGQGGVENYRWERSISGDISHGSRKKAIEKSKQMQLPRIKRNRSLLKDKTATRLISHPSYWIHLMATVSFCFILLFASCFIMFVSYCFCFFFNELIKLNMRTVIWYP